MSQDTPAKQEMPAIEPVSRQSITPRESFKEAAADLRRPFTENAVKWKVQSTWGGTPPKGALIVGYIDARLVIERLNALVPHLWVATFASVEGFRDYLECHLTIRHPDTSSLDITRSDVGTGNDPKARRSDALKRAAVHFGIGVSLYAIPRQLLNVGKEDTEIRNRGQAAKARPVIDDRTERYLRSVYGSWLVSPYNTFGEPLDHGDVEGAVGDVEGEAPPAGEPAEKVEHEGPPDDDRALDLVRETWDAWEKTPAADKRKATKSGIDAMLKGAKSHDELEKVLEHVRGLSA